MLRFLSAFGFALLLTVPCGAQTTQSDTAQTAATQKPSNLDSWEGEEQILNPIHIEAVIEQPRVTLIPKRAKTPIEDMPLRFRSFGQELKTRPQYIDDYGKELESAARIKKLKKVLDKNQN